MAANGGAGPSGFEDQVRRMISTNDTLAQNVDPSSRPTVRLPPREVYLSGSATRGSPTSSSNASQPVASLPPSVPHAGFALGQNGPMHPQRQNQRQRRMQAQAQYSPQINGPLNQPHLAYQSQQPLQPHHRVQHQPQSHQSQLDPNAFHRGGQGRGYYQQQQQRQLFNPSLQHGPPSTSQPNWRTRQAQYLDAVAATVVSNAEMTKAEHDEKEAFRLVLQQVIHDLCAEDSSRLPHVTLECFGSFKSGFASAGSDMDLVIVLQDGTPYTACFSLLEDDLPRLLEKRLLQLGYGARLLSRTRVPIIKICEKPGESLLDKLRQEREKWDSLDNEQKYPHLHQDEQTNGDAENTDERTDDIGSDDRDSETTAPANGTNGHGIPLNRTEEPDEEPSSTIVASTNTPEQQKLPTEQAVENITNKDNKRGKPAPRRREPWTRERKAGPLDFPKSGIGIQCDINFFNPLGLHNTQLLRCYSKCDPRVRPVILFVKAWAKQRKINSSYSGTLSSYGYVLMVLHYLMNVARPPVIPNIQLAWRPNPQCTPHGTNRTEVDGWTVDFWRVEKEITDALHKRQMSTNRESLGALLAGFFQYYSSQGGFPQFHWMGDVLSLRTAGGILTKADKGWVKAMMEDGEGKKITHRYLFCIEDPFELTHNVARTVTHPGIVAIRDEFRRAWRILSAAGNGQTSPDGELFAELVEVDQTTNGMGNLKIDDAKNLTAPARHEDERTQGPRPPKARGHSQKSNSNVDHAAPSLASKALDLTDNDAFPGLGGGSKTKYGRSKKALDTGAGEISGDRAKAYLEELKRKKDEAHAEQTAYGAAESVLGGDD